MLPFVAINGCLLARAGQQPIDFFNAEVSDAFPFPFPIFVPIDMPSYYERFVKSAARRALGPQMDTQEKSGVVFAMRCIGLRTSGAEEVEEVPPDDDEEEVEATEVQGDFGDMPLEALNAAQLRKQFGRSALDMVGAMFQHQSKIGEPGRFMTRFGRLLEGRPGRRVEPGSPGSGWARIAGLATFFVRRASEAARPTGLSRFVT